MTDRDKISKGLQCIIDGTVRCESCGYAIDKHGHHLCQQECAKDVLALLKEQEEQKRKWLQTIADTQLAISPTGYESEDELAKRGWEWNGLQIAWEIIAGEERSEHPRLVRCNECTFFDNYNVECMKHHAPKPPYNNWFCADGKRRDGSNDQVSDRVPGRMGHHGDYSEDKR